MRQRKQLSLRTVKGHVLSAWKREVSPELERANIGPMTIRATPGRRFIEQDSLALYFALQRVAHRTCDVRMPPLQWELRALIVIERRWRPSLDDVAVPALGNSILCDKLPRVRIGMTRLASLRRSLELNFVRPLRRLVAIAANDSTVRAHQRKFRLRMIEAPDVNPGPRVVTGFAAQRPSVRTLLRHAFLELALVRIGMASGTSAILKMEWQNLVGSAA